jgi:pyruvate,water dikinase
METPIRRLNDIGDGDQGLVGGKGANLARLVRLGMPVPPGFVITTDAYYAVLTANSLTGTDPESLRAHPLRADP